MKTAMKQLGIQGLLALVVAPVYYVAMKEVRKRTTVDMANTINKVVSGMISVALMVLATKIRKEGDK